MREPVPLPTSLIRESGRAEGSGFETENVCTCVRFACFDLEFDQKTVSHSFASRYSTDS